MELKPCPFCGQKATLQKDEIINTWFIECSENCDHNPHSLAFPNDPKEGVIASWNTRIPDTDKLQSEISQLRSELEKVRNQAIEECARCVNKPDVLSTQILAEEILDLKKVKR